MEALFTYLVIDAVLSLVVFFSFRYSTRLQDRLRFVVRSFLGVNNLDGRVGNIEYRLGQEIRNRKILKDRVSRMDLPANVIPMDIRSRREV